jgi:diacylglycerol kinase family enzyme
VNGNAKSVTEEVITTLDEILEGGDLFVSRRLEEGPEIARMLLNRGYGTVLTGGGDGTFTMMVTQIIHEARKLGKPLPRFGFLKLGTGNALAWVVGASGGKRKGLSVDLKRLREEAGSRAIRLVEVEGIFAPFCGFGADAVVLSDYDDVKKALLKTPLRRYAAGPLGYAISATTRSLPSYLFRPVPHCRVINEGADAYRIGPQGARIGTPIPRGETVYEGPARVCGLATIPYFGYGFRAFPYAEERSDRMSLRVTTISPVPFVANFRAIWKGEYDNPNYMFDYLVEAVTIEIDPPTPFQIGGDPRGERSSITARVSPQTIRLVDFYAPPSAA